VITILHIADIHLDRVFASADDRRAAVRRRAELRDALLRALAAGRDQGVDAICLAGDVYEHETVTADTAAFLEQALGGAGVPVLVAPGNHDPWVPGSVWERVRWPENVHVFTRDAFEPYELAGDAVVWGAAFTGRDCGGGAVTSFAVPDDRRTHLLLVHAALVGEQWLEDAAHRPVTRRQLEATGAAHVMLGHFHDGRGDDFLRYPGSPEPLGWGERDGDHGAALVRVEAGGVTSTPVPLACRRYVEAVVSVDGARSSAEVERAVRAAAVANAGASLRVVVTGEVDPGCEVDVVALVERCGEGTAELVVRDRTVPAYDLGAIAAEATVRGRFAAGLLESKEPHARDALIAGLRALDGRPLGVGDAG
jgi:DNA repair exonuclease SbcCD nuclease subunit